MEINSFLLFTIWVLHLVWCTYLVDPTSAYVPHKMVKDGILAARRRLASWAPTPPLSVRAALSVNLIGPSGAVRCVELLVCLIGAWGAYL
jgi:hypothetical protein